MQIKVRTVSWRPVIPLITSFRPQLVKTALRLVAVVENCNYNHTLSLWLALCLAWQPQSLRSRLALERGADGVRRHMDGPSLHFKAKQYMSRGLCGHHYHSILCILIMGCDCVSLLIAFKNAMFCKYWNQSGILRRQSITSILHHLLLFSLDLVAKNKEHFFIYAYSHFKVAMPCLCWWW